MLTLKVYICYCCTGDKSFPPGTIPNPNQLVMFDGTYPPIPMEMMPSLMDGEHLFMPSDNNFVPHIEYIKWQM